MAVPNKTTPIDTKLLVSTGDGVWEVRYFAGMTPHNTPLAWGNGLKSTTAGAKAYGWLYVTLAEDAPVEVVPPNLATLEQRIADLIETVDGLQSRLNHYLPNQ